MNSFVVIVDDPEKGPVEGNFKVIGTGGKERCQHLKGDRVGEYSCGVHDRKWYKKTPCFSHGQLEMSKDCNCRMGEHILKKGVR